MEQSANQTAAATSGLETRITSQGQVSVPASIRKKLGVEPGSTLVWMEQGDSVVVKKRGSYTTNEIHEQLFPSGPPKKRSLKELKDGIADYIREKHARS
jgi:antitoxin PrlF